MLCEMATATQARQARVSTAAFPPSAWSGLAAGVGGRQRSFPGGGYGGATQQPAWAADPQA